LKIIVLVKETFDTEAKILLESPNNISQKDVKYIINPYDEFAIEEALRIVEKFGGEVILCSVGREDSQITIRSGLALGADRAKLIVSGATDSITVSKFLAQSISQEGFDLILAGWVAIDDNNAQVPARLSELLQIPLVNVVIEIEISEDKIICRRDSDDKIEIVETGLPAIIAVQRGINEPRYPTVKNILQAKKKKIEFLYMEKIKEKVNINISYDVIQSKRKGLLIDGSSPQKAVTILVEKLKEAKVL